MCTDERLAENNKGVLGNVFKQATINMIKNKPLSAVSLPIKIFDTRTNMQRMADLWSSAPIYLKKASEAENAVERMKNVIAFSISSIYMCTSQLKPFQAFIGETHQGSFSDGTRFYCEHINHHPPISSFLVEGPNKEWRLDGHHEIVGKMGANNVISGLRGPNNLVFADGTRIRFNTIDFKIEGTVMGDRKVRAIGNLIFEDLTNNLRAVITLDTYSEKGLW